MNKPFFLLLVTMFAGAPALAQEAQASAPHAAAKVGEMIVYSSGGRLAPVDRVADDGSAEVIVDGRVVTIPAASLSMANGHLTTNLTKAQVLGGE